MQYFCYHLFETISGRCERETTIGRVRGSFLGIDLLALPLYLPEPDPHQQKLEMSPQVTILFMIPSPFL